MALPQAVTKEDAAYRPALWDLRRTFAPSVLILAVLVLVFFLAFVEYNVPEHLAYSEHVAQYYTWLIDVEMMIFFGFGFLMTFLRRYSYGAVGLNFFTSAIVMLEGVLIIGAVQQVMGGGHRTIRLDIPLIIDATFCAGSAMIAFGAVIGKTSPTQLTWLLAIMVPVYALNQHLVFKTLNALDIGGSISIHVFGAYYGLAASMVFSSRRQRNFGTTNPKNSSSYNSNIFSMVGTLFLWIYWPSFNGALASLEAGGSTDPVGAPQQFYCVVNTLFSLLGSCVATFAMSAALNNGRLDMMHIQNATLAGGVAMGSAAGLRLSPGGALIVGLFAGSFSTFGFARLLPLLERRFKLGDTCGVHNLHGLPGILGGLVAGFAAFNQPEGMAPHGNAQLGYQVAAVAATVAIAAISGALAAAVVSRRWAGKEHEGAMLDMVQLFDDGMFWAGVECEGINDSRVVDTEPSDSEV